MSSVEPMEPDECFDGFDGPVVPSPEPKRKRRKYRRYPRPECTPDQKKALWEYQKHLCPICLEPVTLEEGVVDHSYRNSKTRGVLHRSPCNAGLGMFKDSPARLRNALAYLRNPPAKALGFGESEKERSS
jgi:Recombination endonuclease VII